MARRRCRYCHCLFTPDPCVKDQFACSRPACQTKRAEESKAEWRDVHKHQGYFRGRYPYLKEWLAEPEHAGYLRNYRRERARLRGQVLRLYVHLLLQLWVCTSYRRPRPPPELIRQDLPSVEKQIADIQDEIRSLCRSVSGIQARLPACDIQDEIST
jgi:hypothetical protein